MKHEIEQSLEEHHSMEKQLEQQQQEQLEHQLQQLEQLAPASLPSKILLCPLEAGVR